MKKTILYAALLLGLGFAACTSQTGADESAKKPDSLTVKPEMKNLVSIVEIPVTDFGRAVAFYQSVLGITIEEVAMDGVQMGILPGGGETVNVVLAKGKDYQPSTSGALVYLNAGDDLQPALDKIEKSGGTVLVPKTAISPEMGFFALFTDTEGNKMGLHSLK